MKVIADQERLTLAGDQINQGGFPRGRAVWLTLADNELNQVVSRRTSPFRLPLAFQHFNLESHFVGLAIIEGNEETAHVEQSANFRIDALEENLRLQRGAQRSADFIQDVQLFAAAGGLLNQVAIFDRHANLVSKGEQKPELGGGEIAVVGGSE